MWGDINGLCIFFLPSGPTIRTHFLPTLPKGQAISVAAGQQSATRGIKRSPGFGATTGNPWRQAVWTGTIQKSPRNGSRNVTRSSEARPNPRYQRTRSVGAVEGVGATRRGEAQKALISIKNCKKTRNPCAAGRCGEPFLTLTAAPMALGTLFTPGCASLTRGYRYGLPFGQREQNYHIGTKPRNRPIINFRLIVHRSYFIVKKRQFHCRSRASDVERWRNAPDPKGPSDSEPRNVATALQRRGAPKSIHQ